MSFEIGRSGNPNGSNAKAQIVRAARREAEDCIQILKSVAIDTSAPAAVRAEAASKILELGWPHRQRHMEAA